MQKAHPHQHFTGRTVGRLAAPATPALLDLANTVCNNLVIATMRPAVQRQAKHHCRLFDRRQKQAVDTEIIKAHALTAHRVEQSCQAMVAQKLPGNQVMPLHSGLIARISGPVYRTKGQAGADNRIAPPALQILVIA